MLKINKIILLALLNYYSYSIGQDLLLKGLPNENQEEQIIENKIFTNKDIYLNTNYEEIVYNKDLKDLFLISHQNGSLECYDTNCNIKWIFNSPEKSELSNCKNEFHYEDGVIYAIYSSGYIYAINTSNGKPFWQGKVGMNKGVTHFFLQTAKPTLNQIIVTSRGNQNVYSIDTKSGKLKWNYSFSSPNIITTYAAFKEKIFIATDPLITDFNVLTGEALGQKNFESNFGKVVTGKNFIVTYLEKENKIVALKPNWLEKVWEYKINENHHNVARKIFISDDIVYFGTESIKGNSGLYCLDEKNGNVIWKKNIEGDIERIQQIDNTIYGHTKQGKLFYKSKTNKLKILQLKNIPISNFQKHNNLIYFNTKDGLVKYNLKNNKEQIIIKYQKKNNNHSQILLIK